MRVQTVKTGGIVSSVVLVGADGEPVPPVTRFLRYVLDSGRGPNTALAYGYDLRLVFEFFAERGLTGANSGQRWPWNCWDGCAAAAMSRWRWSPSATARSPGTRVGSSQSAGRCGSGCRAACPGRCVSAR
ncbi:hypothetical protein [Rhodococcus opacus]|uniref:hypothetical protein n=1 Tax=Rhodococcus opacus TaxID=37919 RepID=UPI00211E6D94|nr:hypothetical protein [Rhodococcus opacus]